MSFKMKKLFFALFLLAQVAQSQEQETASVEKSIFGIQTGFFGAWVHNESKLSNEISLRSEIGLDIGIIGNSSTNDFLMVPSLRIEPRWYYNLDKRSAKGKNIKNNSGNFLSLTTTYNPDWFMIPEKKNLNFISSISVIPKWAIKRTYGNHFTFETGVGVGYIFYTEDYGDIDGEVGLDLHLRVGYTF
jgi:hypothetical protein